MRIVFCAYDRPNHLASGPNVWVKRLIPDLINRSFEVKTIFIHSGEKEDCYTIQWFKKKKLPIATLNNGLKPFIEDQIKWILKEVKLWETELIIANLVAPAFYTQKYILNIPVIPVLHSDDPFYRGMLNNFFSENAKIKLTELVAISDYHSDIALSINAEIKVKRIPCGTPVPKQMANYNSRVLKVLYVGRITEEAKQISKLALSFCHIANTTNNIKFSIYGDGPEKEKLVQLLKDNDLHHKVSFYGPVAAEQIQEVMLSHQIFTLLSDFEGMPIALMEAMACGLVPVCMDQNSGIGELIQNGFNGFIVKNRDEDYTEKINQLCSNPDLWKKMSVNARQTIENGYSSEITHSQWADLIKSLENEHTKKVKIPLLIKIKGEPLVYGDIRKPPLISQFKQMIGEVWFSFRLLIRPRARIRAIFQK